jgi:hypothetical protein
MGITWSCPWWFASKQCSMVITWWHMPNLILCFPSLKSTPISLSAHGNNTTAKLRRSTAFWVEKLNLKCLVCVTLWLKKSNQCYEHGAWWSTGTEQWCPAKCCCTDHNCCTNCRQLSPKIKFCCGAVQSPPLLDSGCATAKSWLRHFLNFIPPKILKLCLIITIWVCLHALISIHILNGMSCDLNIDHATRF